VNNITINLTPDHTHHLKTHLNICYCWLFTWRRKTCYSYIWWSEYFVIKGGTWCLDITNGEAKYIVNHTFEKGGLHITELKLLLWRS